MRVDLGDLPDVRTPEPDDAAARHYAAALLRNLGLPGVVVDALTRPPQQPEGPGAASEPGPAGISGGGRTDR